MPAQGANAKYASRSLLLRQIPEGRQNLVVQGHKGPLEVLLGLPGQLKLHVRDLLDHVLHSIGNGVPTHLGLPGELRHRLLGGLVEADDHLHHANGLRQRAHEVVLREAVLLEEVLADDLGHLKSALLVLGERVLPHQLHDLLQVVLLLQDLLHLLLEHAVFLVVLLEVWLQHADVLGERDVPIHGGEVLALRQLLVQAPEDLHNAQGGRRHGVGEVAPWRRDGAHNGDGALARRIPQALDAAAALVERCQPRAQVGGVARVCGHLGQAARNLAQGLGPAGGAVGHHRDVVAHVAEVLGSRHAGVDGGLPRGHRHV
mmetsp:Transcript_117684/g.366628  ORF Transcript_117684/g.366628 Transcript_117684/m.366628 type:complete len:316 (-) Transcript_117684:1022-1969(-)